jgi:hypothetical protein
MTHVVYISLGRISTPSASNKDTDSIAVDENSVATPGIGGMRSAAEAWSDLAREGAPAVPMCAFCAPFSSLI